MTKSEIAKRLDDMAIEMRNLSIDMEYFFGFSTWARHAKEMRGAGRIAKQWAEEIRKEVDGDNNSLPTDSSHGRNRPTGDVAQKRKIRNRKTQKRKPKIEGNND